MSAKTNIEWTDATWNPVEGCSMAKGSEKGGCLNCYAARAALRRPQSGLAVLRDSGPRWTGKVRLVEKHLHDPLHWIKPKRIFVNSMSDLFHESLSCADMDKVFAIISQSPQHVFQILTKRPEAMQAYMEAERTPDGIDEAGCGFGSCHANVDGRWPLPNVWLGVSVENQQTANERIPLLLQTPAAVRFVSYEPALGPVDFTSIQQCMDDCEPSREQIDGPMGVHYIRHGAPGIDWLIVGGESGPGARPFDIGWARSVVRQCKAAGVPCFVKQLGADPREGNANGNCRNVDCTHPDCGYVKLKLKDRKGGDPEEWPEDLRVREFPARRRPQHFAP